MGIRVAVNLLSAQGRKTGVGYYAAQLFEALLEQKGDEQIDGFPRGWIKEVRDLWGRCRSNFDGPGQRRGRSGPPTSAAAMLTSDVQRYLSWGYNFLLKYHIRRLLTPRKYDLYHEPNILATPCDVPTVVTLHDLSVLLYPEWHPANRVALFEREFQRTLRQCVHFLTDTEFIRQEVIRMLHIAPERVTCTHLGVRPHLRPLPAAQVAHDLQKLGLPPRYLLYLGTIEPRKNILRLMQAYCALPEALRARWPLLLVGGWGWRTEAIAEFYHAEAKHRGVLHVGYLPDEHTATVYNGARALVFPSFYEGFGLPPVEMMACGGAVLASTAGALVETVGTQAHLVGPEDTDGWRTALARVLQDDDWWQSLRQGATDVASAFNWRHCATETLQAYQRICAPSSRQPGTVIRAA